jgi:hypothetical protein
VVKVPGGFAATGAEFLNVDPRTWHGAVFTCADGETTWTRVALCTHRHTREDTALGCAWGELGRRFDPIFDDVTEQVLSG